MYKATQHLSTTNVDLNVKVHFVIYSIDTSLEVPYLKVYLVKDCEEPPEDFVTPGSDSMGELATIENYLREHEFLTFPSIDYDASQHFLFTLYCHGVVESLFHEEREYVKYIQHRGHLVDEDEGVAYAFFELFPTTTEAEYMTRESFIWPVLMDEILHKQEVCDIPIHSKVTSFFVEHPSFIYLSRLLENDLGIQHSGEESVTPVEELVSTLPVSVYFPITQDVKKTSPSEMDVQKRTQFTAMFGVPRNEQHGNFVFYSYHRSMDILREAGPRKHGLVRLALYPGRTTIDKEEFDSACSIRQEEDEEEEEGNSQAETFDTYYHGNEYHVKRYEQQQPMSYHHVVKHAQL
jgi:hypothetical protein